MYLAQIQTPALPDLPEGPALDRIRGPVEIPDYAVWQLVVIAVLCCLALALLVWGLRAVARRRKNRRTEVPPHEAVLAELDAAEKLTEGDAERFAVLSSLALRRYFEAALGIPAVGRTTLEFLRNLEKQAELDADARTLLGRFLSQCDGIKFARQTIGTEERAALIDAAKQLVRKLHEGKEAVKA